MTTTSQEIHQLIGALKSQFIYQSSKAKKAEDAGRTYHPATGDADIGDTLYFLVKELEKAIEESHGDLEITIRSTPNQTQQRVADLPPI